TRGRKPASRDRSREPHADPVVVHRRHARSGGRVLRTPPYVLGRLIVTVPCATPTSRPLLGTSIRTTAVPFGMLITYDRAPSPPRRAGGRRFDLNCVVGAHAPLGIKG